MSRLYGRISSDRCKTDSTAGGNYRMWFKGLYGSASNPMQAFKAYVTYAKGEEIATVVIDLPSDVDYQVFVDGVLTLTPAL